MKQRYQIVAAPVMTAPVMTAPFITAPGLVELGWVGLRVGEGGRAGGEGREGLR